MCGSLQVPFSSACRTLALSVKMTFGLSERRLSSVAMSRAIASAEKMEVWSGSRMAQLSNDEKIPQPVVPLWTDPSVKIR